MFKEFKPIYFPNEVDIVKEVFLPISDVTNSFDAMSGYFSSELLVELALPLSVIYKKTNSKGRLLISPHLTENDSLAIMEAYERGESILPFLQIDSEPDTDDFSVNTIDCLKFLIVSGRLDIQIVVMKRGLFHTKAWLFDTEEGPIAVHGSSNATRSGMKFNFEQLSVSDCRSNRDSSTVFEELQSRFYSFWNAKRQDSYTISFNDKSIREILSKGKDIPEDDDLDQFVKHVESLVIERNVDRLNIPDWLEYRTGEYSHQGKAVDAWLRNDCRGILSIATGGGKTLTSLTAAALALSRDDKALIVVAVPTKPLIKQWAGDVSNFNICPHQTAGVSSLNIVRYLKSLRREMRVIPGHRVVILTHDALKNTDIASVISTFNCRKMLIADEAHNLGSSGFISNFPDFYDLRLALSATIERQYDAEGTDKLKKFFGDIVFEFSVEEAIGKCLVPFDYYSHRVYLNDIETEKWIDFSQKIRKLYSFGDSESEANAEILAIRRRAVAENACEKISKFHSLLNKQEEKKYTLVFCTDKDKEQLLLVNEVLREENARFRQITSKETSNKRLVSQIVQDFSNGDIHILTSKRVLDEGFNIPPIKYAYIISSNGVEGRWLQRLGRVLRQSKSTGKEFAVIHDFIVIPPDIEQDVSLRTLINNELKRVTRFTELSRNGSGQDGSLAIINELTSMLE